MIPLGPLLSVSPTPSVGGGITIEAVIGIQLALAAVLLAAFSRYVRDRRPRWASRARLGAIAVAVPGLVLVLAGVLDVTGGSAGGPVTNPIADTVTSVDRGAVVYDASCARCHGVDALGGGVDAGTTQIRPSNLRSGHLNQHSDSDIYLWISNGLTGGMPAWSGTLSETDRWNLVNYLRSINGTGPTVGPSPSQGASGSGVVPAGQGSSSSGGPPAATGLAVAGTLGSVLLGWLAFGFRRLGRPRHRRSGGRTPFER
jgi:mono/diheme cytochrome c family protein